MVLTIFDIVGVLFTWSLHTSKWLLSGSGYMSKKGILSILSKRRVESSEK